MDLWVVAAAAGAGYLAKQWQNIFREKESTSGFSSESSFLDEPQSQSLIKRMRDKTCPIKKLSDPRSKVGKDNLSGEVFTETSRIADLRGREATCSSALNHEWEVGRHDDGNVRSQYMFSSEFRDCEKFEHHMVGNELDNMSDIPKDSTWEMGISRSRKKSVRSKRLHLQFIRPRTSLDSCLMAQMDRENVELEEYLRTPLSSPCTSSLKPFLVSDGRWLVSKARSEFGNGWYSEVHPKVNNEVVGVPRLPQVNAVDHSKKFRSKNQIEKSYFSSNLIQFDTRAGCSRGRAFFCLGMSIGILSTIVANKVEVEKLRKSSRQSENLVEDIEDELEMQDSLTVKEIINDDDPQDVHGISSVNENSDVFSNEDDMNLLIRCGDEESVCLRKADSISNIEAELEAELERLELSMKGSSLSGELNQEFDLDDVAELVCRELQTDIIHRRSSSEPTLDHGSHSPTPHLTKDGVSPHELSLRLHEVIQLRLEERIVELEAELAKSQNHIHRLISERSNSWRDASNSPRPTETRVMKLWGDALDAYNKGFEELIKSKQSEDNPSREEAVPISITGIQSSDDDDDNDDNDDDDMLLIKQIVEKARQGSPAILRAGKAMVSP